MNKINKWDLIKIWVRTIKNNINNNNNNINNNNKINLRITIIIIK